MQPGPGGARLRRHRARADRPGGRRGGLPGRGVPGAGGVLDPYVRRSALRHAPESGLTRASAWELERLDEWARDGLALIRLTGFPDPHVFDDIDPARAVLSSAELSARARDMMLGGTVQWTIVAAPNAGWATQVFGEPDLERLWEAVSVAMRLDAGDAADVVAEWSRHRDLLHDRARR